MIPKNRPDWYSELLFKGPFEALPSSNVITKISGVISQRFYHIQRLLWIFVDHFHGQAELRDVGSVADANTFVRITVVGPHSD